MRTLIATKRTFDAVAATAALAAMAPVLAAVAVAVAVTNGRPVLFRQQRAGRGGVPFEIIKFRTMRAPREGETGPDYDGQRLTRLGRLLRATSIDELPTLVNVVRGEMSLVGPRPLPVAYLRRYSDEQARRHEVRPGITGWAQVNGRNTVPWDERLALDVWYVDHANWRLDLRIIARTVGKVITRSGIDRANGTTMTEFTGPPT